LITVLSVKTGFLLRGVAHIQNIGTNNNPKKEVIIMLKQLGLSGGGP